MTQYLLILFFGIFLVPRMSYSVGYSYALGRGQPVAFELFADAATLTLSKVNSKDDANLISESGTGYRAGFSGAFRFVSKNTMFGAFDFLSVDTSGGNKTLGHLEQGLGFEMVDDGNHKFRFAFGWQIYYFNSKPVEYGYQALAGPFLSLSYDFNAFVMYLKYAPVINSGTTVMSNVNNNIVLKFRIAKSEIKPTYLNLEVNQIKFYSSITQDTSLSNQAFIGFSRVF